MMIRNNVIAYNNFRRRLKIIALLGSAAYVIQLRYMIGIVEETTTPTTKVVRRRPSRTTRSLLPSCNPHLNNHQPIKRIYFYHVRKAGGTMIRKYLTKVAKHHSIDLKVLEFKHASYDEEVGSRSDTLYITNLRDPVERSISHFKYDARWGCNNLVKNKTFVPSTTNARPFAMWNFTGGFVETSCGSSSSSNRRRRSNRPFYFEACAVNCYIQTFSGNACTHNNWYTEYNVAWDRLMKYNIILMYSKFNNPRYIQAVKNFFGGVQGFGVPSSMFCGDEAREANRKVPLRVSFEHVLQLTRLNKMDNRLYKDFVSPCWDDDKYSFPKIQFLAQKNRTVDD